MPEWAMHDGAWGCSTRQRICSGCVLRFPDLGADTPLETFLSGLDWLLSLL